MDGQVGRAGDCGMIEMARVGSAGNIGVPIVRSELAKACGGAARCRLPRQPEAAPTLLIAGGAEIDARLITVMN